MNTEKMIYWTSVLLREYDAKTGGNFAESVINNPWSDIPNDTNKNAYCAAANLLVELRQQLDAAGGSKAKKRTSALLRVFFCCPESRPGLRGWVAVGDKWALCDNYRLIITSEKAESVPDADTKAGGAETVKRIYDNVFVKEKMRVCDTVALPSVADLKMWISTHKRKNGKRVTVEPIEALPGWWCNPQWLIDLIECVPDAVAHKPENSTSPLYIFGADGEAILLPVKPRRVTE